MPNSLRIIVSPRDEALLKLIARTPVTKQMVLKASRTFPEPFADERRVRRGRKQLHQLLGRGNVPSGRLQELRSQFRSPRPHPLLRMARCSASTAWLSS